MELLVQFYLNLTKSRKSSASIVKGNKQVAKADCEYPLDQNQVSPMLQLRRAISSEQGFCLNTNRASGIIGIRCLNFEIGTIICNMQLEEQHIQQHILQGRSSMFFHLEHVPVPLHQVQIQYKECCYVP